MLTPCSYLYVPGDRPEMLAKAATRGAHALIVDLEDGVAPDRKAGARETVSAWLGDRPLEPEVWVRVNNGAEGISGDDLSLLADHEGVGVVLPKATSAESVAAVAAKNVPVIPLIESAAGIMALREIAGAEGVERLVFGEADLAADLGCDPSADVLHPLRMQVVVSSSAAGLIEPIGGVSTNFSALDEFRTATNELRRMGFGARTVIHPNQVDVVNEVFAPDPDELEEARDLVRRADEAEAEGRGVFVDRDGSMVDIAVVRRARRIIARAENSA